mmetsp:Transcript_20866/g.49032  ORF Transcript_20866/g.49032 Transcript_20866/m.49032 type:complete len:303 (+) Transcript_20866:131-1039(+)
MGLRLRSIFKRKQGNRDDGTGKHRATSPLGEGGDASTASNDASVDSPPSRLPIDQPPPPPPASPPTMTASQSQFVHSISNEASTGQKKKSPWLSLKRGENSRVRSSSGVPIVTSTGADDFSPSAANSRTNSSINGFVGNSATFSAKNRPRVRPSAKASAFGGAPRYDWMDIETTAAIKVQAAYRRLIVQNYLDREGLSTPGMRNRRRRLEARYRARGGGDKYQGGCQVNEDVPFPFNLCGVGLLFGDGTLEDERIVNGIEKRKKSKARTEAEAEDERLRRFRMRKKDDLGLEEGVEVVESFD